MVSELESIVQSLLATVDELPGISQQLADQARRLHAGASWLGDISNRTGDQHARHAAMQLHDAARWCEQAIDRTREAHRRGHQWAAEKVGTGVATSAGNSIRLLTSQRSDRIKLSRPPANATVVVDNLYSYETDGRGRVVKAHAFLVQVDVDHPRNEYAQRTLRDKIPRVDDAGHIFARIFKGPGNKINLIPMEGLHVNRGQYKTIENQWRAALEDDDNLHAIDVTIEFDYDDDTHRPAWIDVEFSIGDERHAFNIDNDPSLYAGDESSEPPQ